MLRTDVPTCEGAVAEIREFMKRRSFSVEQLYPWLLSRGITISLRSLYRWLAHPERVEADIKMLAMTIRVLELGESDPVPAARQPVSA
jgi:hypothetical protein